MSREILRKRLVGISKCSINGEPVRDLYKLLMNKPEIWELAYANISSNDGATTKGVDGVTADGHSLERNQEIMNQLRNGTYRPKPTRRVYIPKSNGKKRPLGIPSFTDRLVQEACRIILEAIYEPIFSKFSFGFRKGMGCHDAIHSTSNRCRGVKWFIEFDIQGYFDNIDHQILMKLLRNKIKDERFTALIGWMLKAGYMEDWKFNKTHSGTPQGGVISPILANIYLHELDTFLDDLCLRTHRGERRRENPERKKLTSDLLLLRKQLNKLRDENLEVIPTEEQGGGKTFKYAGWNKEELVKELRKVEEEGLKLKYSDPSDPNYRRLQFTRYADDFLLGFIGSKEEAEIIMMEIKDFLRKTLHLECSEEKTKIAHHSEGVIFLGYLLKTHTLKANANRVRNEKRNGKNVKIRRRGTGNVNPEIPESKVRDFVKSKRYGNLNNRNDWKALHRAELTSNSDYEILAQFNAEMRGFAEYYKLAVNFYKGLGLLYYIAQTSLVKTLANKHKTTSAKLYQQYTDGDDKRITVVDGKYKKEWFKLKDINRSTKTNADMIHNHLMHASRSEITERLNAERCEYCGKTDGYFEVHHVRKMADIKEGKELWQKVMIARNRKKIVLCIECHDLLHAGRLPDYRYKAAT